MMIKSSGFCFLVVLCVVVLISFKLPIVFSPYYGDLLLSDTSSNENRKGLVQSSSNQAQHTMKTDTTNLTDAVERSANAYLQKTVSALGALQNLTDDVMQTENKSDCNSFIFDNISLSDINLSTYGWQTVIEGTEDIQVYSAYWDDRSNPPKVRILGIDNLKNQQQRLCLLWYGDGQDIVIIEATLQRISSRDRGQVIELFYDCMVEPDDLGLPTAVSLIVNRCDRPINFLLVQNHKLLANKKRYNLISCLGPLHSNYSSIHRLVEAVEVDNILGVDLVVLYNFSMSSSLDPYVKSFLDDGLVHYYNWYNPVLYEARYYGQCLLINDCMYRYMYQANYIIVKDVDETVVPRGAYTSLINLLKDLPHTNIAEYNIRSVLFSDTLNPSGSDDQRVNELHIGTLININRSDYIWPHKKSSKYIINPRRVLQGHVHLSRILLGNNIVHNVAKDLALVHHYRREHKKKDLLNNTVTDRRMHFYRDEIIKKIKKRLIP